MDISEYLASQQPDTESRQLARSTHMGIPDADNDPSTKDAAGQYSSKWDDLPESDNIEDRRDESSSNNSGQLAMGMPQNGAMDEGVRYKAYGGNGVDGYTNDDNNQNYDEQEFADGGEVQGEEDVPDDNADVTEPVTDGAIPDDTEQQSPDDTEAQQRQPDAKGGGERWRTAAMEGINEAIKYGYDQKHAVNRPVQDEGQEDSVRSMLKGDGSMDGNQFAAAQQAADPEGQLDESSRLQKTLGSIYDFYKGKYGANSDAPDDPAAKAVWSALQYARKLYDAYSAHATAAADHGDGEGAAKSATAALSKVPDGTNAEVKWQGPNGVTSSADATHNGVVAAADANNRVSVGKQQADGTYAVTITDPESGKTTLAASLTHDQLKHALAEGFDKFLHRGTTSVLGAASQVAPGEAKRLGTFDSAQAQQRMAQGRQEMPNQQSNDPQYAQAEARANRFDEPGGRSQDMAELNGLPKGMNIQGLSVGQIGQLRARYQQQQVMREPDNSSREGIARGVQEGANQRTQMTNTGAERRSRIAAGVNPDTGVSEGNLTGRAAQNNANDNRIIEARVKSAIERMGKPPTEDQVDQLRQRAREGYYREQGRQPPGQQPTASPGGQAAQRRQQQGGQAQTKIVDGWEYRANPATKQWEPVRRVQ